MCGVHRYQMVSLEGPSSLEMPAAPGRTRPRRAHLVVVWCELQEYRTTRDAVYARVRLELDAVVSWRRRETKLLEYSQLSEVK